MPKYSNPKDFPPAAGHQYYDGPTYSQPSQTTVKPAPGAQKYDTGRYGKTADNPQPGKASRSNSGPSKARGNSTRIRGNPGMPYKK